jgi:hypothetical protein
MASARLPASVLALQSVEVSPQASVSAAVSLQVLGSASASP